MELPLPTIFFYCAFSSFLFMVLKYCKKLISETQKLPPHPWKLPLIGNLHQLAGSLPHHSLSNLAQKYGPVMHLQLGEVSTLVISSSEAAKEIMKTHDVTFADRPKLLSPEILTYGCTDIAFAPYGEYWRQLRKICTLELLSTRRVQSFRSVREEGVYDLVDYIRSSQGLFPINLTKKIFSLTNDVVCKTALGMKFNDQEKLLLALQEATELVGGFALPDMFPSLKFLHSINGVKPTLMKAHQSVDRILHDIVVHHQLKRETTKEHKDAGVDQEDLVDVLLRLQNSGDLSFPITVNNIKAVLQDIFIAGTETSSSTVEWAMTELMRNPRVMMKTQVEVRKLMKGKSKINESNIEELSYLKAVIKETLRLHPPIPLLLPREARENVKIFGYDIPKKTRVIVNSWAIMRDPDHWKDPEEFKPERFESNESYGDMKGTDFRYIPFGAGRRMCPGLTFGNASVELPLAALLYHFDWSLADGFKPEDINMEETFGASARKKENLSLIAQSFLP
ncbi:premnaspirodiene oxygenase-like [Impatiens glandulifera]|uniref:premnaspirodiene oxygenase-like n=1 Tax=Impatiens glandulifera TaxID=253017 RepID=UPI001FB11418|nr:premnaspirodiene oxygenase-like [Impatiens glandulifera]